MAQPATSWLLISHDCCPSNKNVISCYRLVGDSWFFLDEIKLIRIYKNWWKRWNNNISFWWDLLCLLVHSHLTRVRYHGDTPKRNSTADHQSFPWDSMLFPSVMAVCWPATHRKRWSLVRYGHRMAQDFLVSLLILLVLSIGRVSQGFGTRILAALRFQCASFSIFWPLTNVFQEVETAKKK